MYIIAAYLMIKNMFVHICVHLNMYLKMYMYVFLWKLANLYTCNIYIFTAINKSIIYVLANVYIYIHTCMLVKQL